LTILESGRCANCDQAVQGPAQKFCPACGQPTPAHRIDWHFLGHELEHSVLHMDRGILYSLKGLMLRPGHLMRDYIEGRRGGQVKPLMLLMIMAAVVVLASKFFLQGDVVGSMMSAGGTGTAKVNAGAQVDPALMAKAIAAATDWMNHHFAAFTLLLLPLEALALKLSFHRQGNPNYPEWLVITAFLTVQTFVLWTLAVPLQRWFPQALLWVVWLALAYSVFSLAQFFHPYPRWKSALRALLGFGVVMLASFVLTMVVAAVVYARLQQA
jgi:hypothetical protein